MARQVTPNAFYTPPKVAQAIWRGLERLGFKGGRILDPATGSGVFFGTMPSEIGAHSEINGVEYDSLTGRIARQLYQQANIDITPFQKRLMPNDYFDLIITNVPFGTTRIYSDKAYSKQGHMLHNYYFAKAIDKVRPGGLVAFITGTGTMQAQDAQATELREELSKKADLIAAFKLPDTTFKENAGTQVTSDILILQKRLDPAKPSEHAQDWGDIGLTFTSHSTNSTHINEYFEKHPENMIGEPTIDWRGSLALDGSGLGVAAELSKLIETLPENIFTPIRHDTQDSLKNTYAAMADATLRDGSFSVEGGKAIQLVEGDVVEVPKANQELVKDFVTLEKSLDNILKAQLSTETTDAELAKLRETLNQNYDNFVQRHGNINSNPVLKILETDPNFGKVASIEEYTEKTETVTDAKGKGKSKTKKIPSASKADIFFKRTASPFQVVNSTDNAFDALRLSLSRQGKIDTDYMSKLTGKNLSELQKELGDLVYLNPETNLIELADEYLSGNVREKLRLAREAAKKNPEFKRNVEALEKVLPVDLTYQQIYPHMGANWIDEKYYFDFIKHLVGDSSHVKISRDPLTGKWEVSGWIPYEKNISWRVEHRATTKADFVDLFAGALNHHYPSRWTANKVVLKEQMIEAREKIDKILQNFSCKTVYEDLKFS